MVRPKLEYPLAVTQFTQSECDRIKSRVIHACLSKMGYNCNSPKEVVYGPSEFFGFGMHDYYIEQGIRQLTALVGHIRQDSETGRLMRIELQWCQVQAGTVKHLLGKPSDPINYIETCWIMSIQDFLWTYGLRIDFTKTPIPVVQCDHDEFLMDALRVRGSCTATELQQMNACRMWLQVARVSDISSADGKFKMPRGNENDNLQVEYTVATARASSKDMVDALEEKDSGGSIKQWGVDYVAISAGSVEFRDGAGRVGRSLFCNVWPFRNFLPLAGRRL
jgi:hypothetical protein